MRLYRRKDEMSEWQKSQDMEEWNLISERLEVIPNYSLENSTTSIQVYFNARGQVLIVGVVDNNYIYWASLTNSDDKEINSSIFNYISKGRFRKVSHLYKAIEAAGFSYEEVERWVRIRLTRRTDDRMSWDTPFGVYFGSDQIKYNGNYFANYVQNYMAEIRQKCKFREADGAYEKVLDDYLALLKADDGDSYFYLKVEKLIDIIKSEEYLYGSENSEVRNKYIELRKRASELYNRYMSAVR